MLSAADDELAVTCLSDGDCRAFVTTLVTAVDCYQVVAAAAADADFNGGVIADNQWTGAEAVRSDWGEGEDARFGSNDGASNAQRVAC